MDEKMKRERLSALLKSIELDVKEAKRLLRIRKAGAPLVGRLDGDLIRRGESLAVAGAMVVDTIWERDYAKKPRGATTTKVRRALGYWVQS